MRGFLYRLSDQSAHGVQLAGNFGSARRSHFAVRLYLPNNQRVLCPMPGVPTGPVLLWFRVLLLTAELCAVAVTNAIESGCGLGLVERN